MKKLLKWLLIITLALLVSLAIVVFNPGLIRAPLENYLSETAGYPIRLEGELKIRPGGMNTVTARNVHVSAPDWSRDPVLLAIGHLELKLATAALFNDIIVIESLSVDGLELNLETDAEGRGNWLSANRPPAAETADTGGVTVIFANVEAGDAAFRFRNGGKDLEHVFNIVTLEHDQGPDGMMHTSLNGDLNSRPVEFTSTIGPYDNLLNGQDINISASGQFGQLVLSAEGFLDDLLKPRLPKFDITLQGPDTDEVSAMFGLDDLGSGAFALRAVGGEENGSFVANIDGDLGDILLNASVRASDVTQLGTLDMNITANGPSLGAVTSLFGIEDWPDKPFSLNGDIERIGSTLNVSELTLSVGGTLLKLDALMSNFPKLDSSRIKLSVAGDEISQFQELLGLPELATGAFELKGNLDVNLDGVERVNVEIQTSLGQATLSGTLGMDPGYAGSKMRLHLDGPNARTLMSLFNIDALPEQPFNLNTEFEIVEGGMQIERGVLVTIGDDRVELGGFIAFIDGGNGTKLNLKVGGQSVPQVLNQIAAGLELPDRPYEVAGQLNVLDDSLQLEGVSGNYGSINMSTGGVIRFTDQLVGSELALGINGNDLHAWKEFAPLREAMDIFVPGQPFEANATMLFEADGWRLRDVSGQVGKTEFGLDGLISNKEGLTGSLVRFSINGPGLSDLLTNQDENAAVIGAFESSGTVSITEDTLSVRDFEVEGEGISGNVDVALDWPSSEAMNADFEIDVRGDDLRPFLPPIEGFQPATTPYDVQIAGQQKQGLLNFDKFDATVGGLKLLLTGNVESEAESDSINVALRLASEDLSTLGLVNGDPLPALGLELSADLVGNLRKSFLVRNLKGSLGESRLEGSADISLEGQKPKFSLVVQSDLIDMRPFLDPPAAVEEPVEEAETKTSEKKTRLIPPTPLPLEALDTADISIKLEITEMRFHSDSMTDLALEAELIDRMLEVSEVAVQGPRGNISGAFSIEPTSASHANVKLDLTTKDLVLNLSGQPEENLGQVPALDVGIDVSGSGSNLQELAGSVNGSLYMVSTGGKLQGVNLSILDTFILDEIFGLLLPKSKQEDNLSLECAALIVTMTDGLLGTDPALAFTTDLIALVAKGTLDLKTEEMQFNFNATPNNALKISASELVNPYILVAGTLAKPSVGLDPGKVLVQGGLAVGTAGISVLAKGLIDRVGNTVPLCEQLLEQVEQQQ
jgi:uncharacterized protein involved in outer membrane biogenesis